MIFLLATGSAFLMKSQPGFLGWLRFYRREPLACVFLFLSGASPGHPRVSDCEARATRKELGTGLVGKSRWA